MAGRLDVFMNFAVWKVYSDCAGQVVVIELIRIGFSLLILLVAGALLVVEKMLLRIGCWLGFHLCEKRSFFRSIMNGESGTKIPLWYSNKQ